jgi:hypothetical protein
MALMDILNAIGGGLSSAGRGIGKGFSVVGKTLADPFYESEEERLARELGGADFGPTTAAGLTGNYYYSPNFKKKKNFWDVLGDIGETTGRVATQVGRQLPILGPYVQAGEYGILKGIGKEDSDWAKGNIFAEREQAYEELQKRRAFEEQERQQKEALFPLELERTRTEIDADKSTIASNEAQLALKQRELEAINARLAAKIQAGGTLADYEVQELDRERQQVDAEIARIKAQTNAENAQARYYDTRGNMGENQPLMTMVEFEQAARAYADSVSAMDVSPGAWQKAYTEYKTNNQWMLTGTGEDLKKPVTHNIGSSNPLNMVGIGYGQGPIAKPTSVVGVSGQSVPTTAPNVSSVQDIGGVDTGMDLVTPSEAAELDRYFQLYDLEGAIRAINSNPYTGADSLKYERYLRRKYSGRK